MDILEQGLGMLGFGQADIIRCKPLLEKYTNELELFNSAYDLVGADNREEIVVRHLLDSLAPFSILGSLASSLIEKRGSSSISFADIGSGGGLPGIPLAVCFPQYSFTLLERMSKRCVFLENCSAVLGLKNVAVDNTEAERAVPSQYDIAVFRAFRPLDKKMFKTILRLVRPGGYLAAYKGKKEKIEEEMEAIKDVCPVWNVESLSSPFLDNTQRNLVIIPKDAYI